MKKCTKCKKEKSIENYSFRKKSKGTFSSICKSCHSENRKRHYRLNRGKIRNQTLLWRKNYSEWFKNLKKKLKCSLCEEKESCCLEFHHLDSSKKETEVSNAIKLGWSKKRVLKEIEKCAVLCSNCHRKLHAGLVKLE